MFSKAEDWRHGGFGLYLHWPYCLAKCPYCDFNSHVAASIDHAAWQRAFLSEIERVGAETRGRTLNSVYFGGGTPSLMPADLVAAMLEKVRATWPISNSLEVTLEANPTSVEAARFAGFRDAGVNRVSLGLQALNDPDLKRLGRMHSVDEGLAALEIARTHFDRVSFDLIYARQDQTLEDWRAELSRALNLSAGHLSLYQLTIEPGTRFGDLFSRGRLRGLPDEDLAADFYFLTQQMCQDAGLPAYEISNHAAEGQESRHNMLYWTYGDYVGIGPGAHGRVTLGGQKHATETFLAPQTWLTQALSGNGESTRVALSDHDAGSEYLMFGLRTLQGLSLDRLRGYLTDIKFNKIKELADLGLLEQAGDTLRATPQGRPVLNALIRELLPEGEE